MLNLFIYQLCLVSSAVLTAVVVEEPQDICSELEFRCDDGSCVSLSSFCDGRRDCSDGSDEASCFTGRSSYLLDGHRVRRQAGRCSKLQWQCRDGSCISFDGKCDGIKDCPDGSDETFPLCRNSRCQSNWFRCTYGACVDGTAPCNGVRECADDSDELLPACRNEVAEVRGQFKCANGESIPASLHCDGAADCADASDESVRVCAGKLCPRYLFQCAYGACVDRGADCNGIKECYDGSDESDELCNRTTTVTQSPITTTTQAPEPGGACVLPPYPAHGRYSVQGLPNAVPGQAFSTVFLNVTCNPGYDVPEKRDNIICLGGVWSGEVVDCVRFCRLNKDPSVEYRCLLSGAAEGSRECNLYEADGTMVRPECKAPDYYFSGVLNYMRCIDGQWDYIARCVPGLTKNGTNITILVKEEGYDVHVGTFQYTVSTGRPGSNAGSNGFNSGNVGTPSATNSGSGSKVPGNPAFQQVAPVTPGLDDDYDIDEGDWRKLSSNVITPKPNFGSVNLGLFSHTNSNGNGPKENRNRVASAGQNDPKISNSGSTMTFGQNQNKVSFSSSAKNSGVSLNIQNGQVIIRTKDNEELVYDKDRIYFLD